METLDNYAGSERLKRTARGELSYLLQLHGRREKAMKALGVNAEALLSGAQELDVDALEVALDIARLASYEGDPRALELLQRVVSASGGQKNDAMYLASSLQLAEAYRKAGAYDQAQHIAHEIEAFQPTTLLPDVSRLDFLNNLAFLYTQLGESQRAIPMFEEVIRVRRKIFPPTHHDLLTSIDNLAYSLMNNGRTREALLLAREARQGFAERYQDETHPDALVAKEREGEILWRLGCRVKAIAIQKELITEWAVREPGGGEALRRVIYGLGYLESHPSPSNPARNKPCPCESGMKYKKCCGA
jgi:tetratricopeptide (TPR) repeat protein